ncbi:MAG: hydrogenase nickel incorporation protein HypB [Candidatus Brocadiaceae bacterium]|nr:hydrogenase nickel incorporation protein HypB [Candidatus Brocadiaceae bacterium]
MAKIEVGRSVRDSNDTIAARNREVFDRHGVYAMNIIGSPGSGKTSILEVTARHFDGRAAAIIGDVRTALDAERLQDCGMTALPIETGGGCHLNATQIADAVARLDLDAIDYLFIENVGNLVCPSALALGEHIKVAVLSVPEGDEKVRKYPALFVRADVVFINKIDLLPHCPYDPARVRQDARKARPNVKVFETSAARNTGFEPWFEFLRQARAATA